jgi:thiosulfate dehydrogenase
MAKRSSSAGKNRSSGGFGKLVLGFLLGIAFLAGAIFLYLNIGAPPVAVADQPFPFENQLVKIPLKARIGREMRTPPFGTGEDVFEAGAHTYHDQCSGCHGIPGHDADFAKQMFPAAPQLWKRHSDGVVGVSDDEPGATYWLVANGVRLTGMPAFKHVLTDTQMWQVSLLLKNADKELPDPVLRILKSSNP